MGTLLTTPFVAVGVVYDMSDTTEWKERCRSNLTIEPSRSSARGGSVRDWALEDSVRCSKPLQKTGPQA